MKKFQKLLVITLALLICNIANALEIVDVRADHWAGQEIVRSIQNGYIQVIDSNKFVPEGTMTRSEFVKALLKVIRRNNEPVVQGTTFKDIESEVKDAGFQIETEEYDFEDLYQIIIKIEK